MYYKKLLITTLMIFFLGSSYASGDKTFSCPPPAKPDSWHFLIAPYGWVPWMTSNVTMGENKMDIDTSPKDVLPALDAVLEVHMEASKGNLTFMLDSTYLKMSQSTDVAIAGEATLTMKQVLVDFGEYYKFASLPVGNSNNRFNVEGFFGGRYWYMNGNLAFDLRPRRINLPDVDITKKWLDPIIGGRLSYRIGDSWAFVLGGDIGGFHLVSNYTWSAKAMGIWQFSRYVGIAAGFRAIGVDYEDGKIGPAKFKMDTTIYGPVFGITFVF